MRTARVKIIKRIFSSPRTGYHVYEVEPEEAPRDRRVIAGHLGRFARGQRIDLQGEVVTHPRYGEQMRVHHFQPVAPSDSDGIIAYLKSPLFPGIGSKTAMKIHRRFGSRAIDTVEKHPRKLQVIPGISSRVIRNLEKIQKDSRHLRELKVFLLPFGVSHSLIHRLFKTHGTRTIPLLRSNPYHLVQDTPGFGFHQADRIATSRGIQRESSLRIRAAILHTWEEMVQHRGGLCFPRGSLVEQSRSFLNLPEELILREFHQLLEARDFVTLCISGESLLCRYRHFLLEEESARRLLALKGKGPLAPRVSDGSWRKLSTGARKLELPACQEAAIKAALLHRVSIISGGPGTGKTTLIRLLGEVFQGLSLKVETAAPTGRAAKRIEESTGIPARTIHRLLRIQPQTRRFHYNQDRPLETDVLIIDEFSMVDVFLLNAILRALPADCRLIILGDRDQLPSVGPGRILQTLIESGRFQTTFLTHNFRQEGTSHIVENAHRIREGRSLILPPYLRSRDFAFLPVRSESHALDKIEAILKYYGHRYPFNSQEIQILVPMYRGGGGIHGINDMVQSNFNPGPALESQEREEFRKDDKVMQVTNNYEKEVFNGELGVVAGKEKERLIVRYDERMVDYYAYQLDQITLAYAISIHKAQGSEFDIVVLVMLPGHRGMLNREIFYTAVSRARKKLLLISTPRTIDRALQVSSPVKRRSPLEYHLKSIQSPANCTPKGTDSPPDTGNHFAYKSHGGQK